MTRRVPLGIGGGAIVIGLLAVGTGASRSLAPQLAAFSEQNQTRGQGRAIIAGGITWDFETGNLVGWQARGTAFANQPTFGDNPVARQRESANPQGKFWIGTYERYQGPGRGKPGAIQGDEPRGTLTSSPFTIPTSLTFRVGGGSAHATRVELLLIDQIEGNIELMPTTGTNSETMREVTWDLAKLAGRQGRIRIVDESSGPWGHINVDDFRFGPSSRGLDKLPPFNRPIPPFEQEPSPRMPDLLGLTEGEAIDLLAKNRLKVGGVSRAEATAKPGTVIKQDRQAGSPVAPGTPVGFVLAIPIPAVVPDVVGSSEHDARAAIDKARLRTGAVRSEPSRAPEGRVIAQSPKGGNRLTAGSAVDLVIATSIRVPVPQLIGRAQREVAGVLKAAELTVGALTQEESRRPAGTVLAQQPPAGALVGIGSAVDIVAATPVTVAVPQLLGQTQPEAIGSLKGAELVAGALTQEESRRPVGTVVRQQPAAGQQVVIGTAVDIVTATPVMVDVPGIVGRTQAEAAGLLKNAELAVGVVRQEESRRPSGTVLSQTPAAGMRVEIGSGVDIVTATPVTVAVPQLVGRPQAEVAGLLKGVELVQGAAKQEESRRPEGTVLSQQPAAGTRMEVGSAVNIVTATPVTVLVPQLVGQTQAEAVSRLQRLELVVGTATSEESRRPVDSVLSQQPAAGTRVVIGTAVAIVTARPVTMLVPELVSRSEAEARQMLTNAELKAGTVSTEESRQPTGSVLRQSTPAGTRVTIGTAVDLVIATPVTVLVPGIVGQTEETARQRLTGVELVAGTVEHRESPAARGTVLAQGINPDARVPIGTAVNLVVAVVETVAVPPVLGLPVEQARRVLLESRLVVGGEERRGTRVEPLGTVLGQSAGAGSRVAIGTAVALTIAVPIVSVPRVIGLPHDDAAAAIKAAGLEVGSVGLRWSLQPGGTVLAQAQAPGAQVLFGTPVALEEARPRVVWMSSLVVLLVIGAGLAGLIKPTKPPVPPISIAAQANADAGEAHVQSDEARAISREVRVQPVVDAGSQELSASADIIQSERLERAVDAPPPEETT